MVAGHPFNQKRLIQAVHDTPLTFGTVWDNSFDWAFYMEPQTGVIYFMTDGNSNKNFQGMDIIKQKKGRTKIYTIGYEASGSQGTLGINGRHDGREEQVRGNG